MNHNKLYISSLVWLLLLLSSNTILPQAQIPNGNFEVWANKSLYEKPDVWYTQDDPTKAVLTTFKQGDAADGTYSLRLVTVADENEQGGDNVMDAYAALANLADGQMAGLLWDIPVDRFHVSVKYNVMPGDAALVVVWIIRNGAIVSAIRYPLTGNSSGTWTPLSLPLIYPEGVVVTPDQIMIGFISSSVNDAYMAGETNPYTPTAGSWLMVDNIYFTLGANPTPILVPNHSFEEWVDVAVTEPLGWSTENFRFIDSQIKPVTRNAQAYEGSWAVRLEVREKIGSPQSCSMHLGSGVWDYGGLPYTDKPQALSMVYKYSPADNDEAFIAVWFKGQPVAGFPSSQFGFMESITTSVPEYQKKGTVFFWPDGFQPEELVVQIMPGLKTGSVLFVDDLKFEPTYLVTFIVKDKDGAPVNNAKVFQDMFPYAFSVNPQGETTLPFFNGTFNYKVVADGYTDYEGSFTLNGVNMNVNIVMGTTTGLGEADKSQKPGLYPNPFFETVYLANSELVARLCINSLNGANFVKTEAISDRYNLGFLPQGLYLVTIELTNGDKINQMLIKK